jgi:hypothetical protein
MHPACGAASSTCNDDTCGVQSTINFTAVAGNTYWIRVGGYGTGGTNTGAFTLTTTIGDPPPPPPPPLPNPGNPSPGTGPDVIVGDIIDVMSWGSDATTSAYSLGTTSCNNGTANVAWVANVNQHPVIGQNLYRWANNRFELVGVSWLKHGFTALTGSLCNTCSGQGGTVLGVGCSDPYGASLNGSQGNLGPRSHVNAANGYYPYPFTSPPTGYIVPAAADPTVGRRCKVLNSDLAVSGRYFAECQYVTADDATYNGANLAVNGLNNVSYKEVFMVNGVLQGTGTNYFVGTTARGWPALKAWTYLDPSVVLNSYDVDVTVPQTAGSTTNIHVRTRFWVGANAVNNGNGTWTYNYTIFNLNSDASVGAFELPCSNVNISAPYQKLPMYHSSEPTTFNAAWTFASDANGARWSTPQTFAQNPNSSAIRYSTAGTFSVTTNTAPVTGTARLSYFKLAGTLDLTGLPIPGNGMIPCAADFNHDGSVDFFDYLNFVDAFTSTAATADFNSDGTIDFFDYLDFVDAFSIGC